MLYKNLNTYFVFSNFFSENRAVYEIISKNVMDTEGQQMRSQNGAYELHAGKARLNSSTHTRERARTDRYVTHCFTTASMIHECASMLRYTYIVCLVVNTEETRKAM